MLEDEITRQIEEIENYDRESYEYQFQMESAHNIIQDRYVQIEQLKETLEQVPYNSQWSQNARNTIKSYEEDIIEQEEDRKINNLRYNDVLSKIKRLPCGNSRARS
ncbi:hypothetical protein RF11_00488 [Thelohanellus kitauei]|uniref:Uncharacterized protein n=1 Tax=Thelohanellus kitauei TaxID=669202 RepID=A0A0C2JH41_THEKT|nr:hypothetical protein RF11_00488 [Thelohanellus kitauei]